MSIEINLNQVVFLLPHPPGSLQQLLSRDAILLGSGPQVDWLWDGGIRLRHDNVMCNQWKLYGHRKVYPTAIGSNVYFRYVLVGDGIEVLRSLEFLLGEPRIRRKHRELYVDGSETRIHVDSRDSDPSTLTIESHNGVDRLVEWRDKLLALGLEELNVAGGKIDGK